MALNLGYGAVYLKKNWKNKTPVVASTVSIIDVTEHVFNLTIVIPHEAYQWLNLYFLHIRTMSIKIKIIYLFTLIQFNSYVSTN